MGAATQSENVFINILGTGLFQAILPPIYCIIFSLKMSLYKYLQITFYKDFIHARLKKKKNYTSIPHL